MQALRVYIFLYMEKVKIIINGQKRSFIIPLEYNEETDSAEIKEFQVDPMPEKDENTDKDIVLFLADLILNAIQTEDKEK